MEGNSTTPIPLTYAHFCSWKKPNQVFFHFFKHNFRLVFICILCIGEYFSGMETEKFLNQHNILICPQTSWYLKDVWLQSITSPLKSYQNGGNFNYFISKHEWKHESFWTRITSLLFLHSKSLIPLIYAWCCLAWPHLNSLAQQSLVVNKEDQRSMYENGHKNVLGL